MDAIAERIAAIVARDGPNADRGLLGHARPLQLRQADDRGIRVARSARSGTSRRTRSISRRR
jgi:hypothetical protein